MIADMLSNRKLNPIVTELFIKGRKLNISFVFIRKSYFAVPKNIRLNSAHYFIMKFLLGNLILLFQKTLDWILIHYFIMKIPNKWELQQIAFNHSSDIDFKDFINLYKKCNAKSYSFLVIDATLTSDNLLLYRMNLSERI